MQLRLDEARQVAPAAPARPGLPEAVTAVLVLLAFALRLYLLDQQSIWWDEGLAAWAARQDPLSIARWTSADVHPPLYFWLLSAWRLLAGDSSFALRFLSVMAGVLLVACSGWLGRSLGGRWAGPLAAAMVAIAPALVWWSQEARPYELAALLVLLSLAVTIRLTDDPPPARRRQAVLLVAYIASTTAALYTLYMTGIVIVLEIGYLLLWAGRRRDRWRRLVPMAVAIGAALGIFLPWAVYVAGRMRTWSVAEPYDAVLFLRLYAAMLSAGVSTNVTRYLWPSLAFVAVLLLAIAGLTAARRRIAWLRAVLLGACVVALPALVFALTLPRGLFYTPKVEARYLVLFAACAYLLIAWGLSRLRAPLALAGTLVIGILAASGLAAYYEARYLSDDYQTVVSTLRAHAQPGDAVVLHSDSDWPTFAYHYPADWTGIPNGESTTATSASSRLQPVVAGHDAVWLVVTPDALRVDPKRTVETYLQGALPLQAEYTIGDKRLLLFAPDGQQRPVSSPSSAVQSAPSGSEVQVLGHDRALRRVRPGETLNTAIYWRGAHCPPNAPVAVEGPDGATVATSDVELCDHLSTGDVHRSLVQLFIPPTWSPGRYRISVAGQDTGTVEILPGRPAPVSASAAASHPLDANFSGKIRLLGYDITTPEGGDAVRPGEQVGLTLYWQAQAPLSQGYTVFTHLLGDRFNPKTGNIVWGQHDGVPAQGSQPTTLWQPGTTVVDQHSLTVDPQAPAGEYALEVGMYDPVTPPYARLKVLDGQGNPAGDQVILQKLRVEP